MVELELNDYQAQLLWNALRLYSAWLDRDVVSIETVNGHAEGFAAIPRISAASQTLVEETNHEVCKMIEMLGR